jgi:allantoicase
MDGWETRRRRTPGNDWCVLQLGLSGIVRQVDIDTNHFLGNHPPHASLDALCGDSASDLKLLESANWLNIIPRSPLNPGSQNLFQATDQHRRTHLRLNIFPDGGVARLRAYGSVVPDFTRFKPGDVIDLAAVENGGVALSCSDMFFSSMNNLIMPGPPANMGDGWETKRRRGPGFDWIILKLGAPGSVAKIEVDTSYFKGNYPDMCSIEACHLSNEAQTIADARIEWKEILPKTKLAANTRHFFEKEVGDVGPVTHLRLNIFPDGGVARLRVWGRVRG